MRYHYKKELVKDLWLKKKFYEDTIAVVKDVASGYVFITNEKAKDNDKLLLKFTLCDIEDEDGLEELYVRVKESRQTGYICKVTLISEYGRKVAEQLPPTFERRNPHRRRAKSMKLYDIDVVEYFVQHHPELQKRRRNKKNNESINN